MGRVSFWGTVLAVALATGPSPAAALPLARARLGTLAERVLGTMSQEAAQSGLDPRLVAAVIRVESTWDPRAVSPAGARGLMQLMPATAVWVASRHAVELRHPDQLFEPEVNLRLGTRYLAYLIGHFGRLDTALLAYNMGPTAARRVLRSRGEIALSGYPKAVMAELERISRLEWNGRSGVPSHRKGGSAMDESQFPGGSDAVIPITGAFDAMAARRACEGLAALPPGAPAIIDFSGAGEISEFGVAMLAYGLSRETRPVTLRGLRIRQRGLFQHFGLELDAQEWAA